MLSNVYRKSGTFHKSINENKLLRHIKLDKPVKIKVNGITSEGIISL